MDESRRRINGNLILSLLDNAKAMRITILVTGLALSMVLMMPGQARAADTEIQISKRDCQQLVRHQASADVEYKPGVDVRGREVVPADVGGTQPKLRLPNQLTIDIGIDLGKRLGIGGGGNQFSSNVSIGKVTFDRRSGQITFNDQPIGNAHTNAIALKCREILSQGR